MPASESLHKTTGVPEDPESFSVSLAHVITSESGQEIVLGQAWLAGPGKLVTCAHVVEAYAYTAGKLAVKFPSSSNRYLVKAVSIHPQYAKQADQLVRFDAAVLAVDLDSPEKDTSPLPISYSKSIKTYQPLSAIRYPVHLGQYTSAPRPLAQLGRMLGLLRQGDNYHVLHDLALAPGDSGAPIFDESTVVALHCGDTASLPGLNLPTTSIRLGLWIDALKELGIPENTLARGSKGKASALQGVLAFFIGALISFGGVLYLLTAPKLNEWDVKNPAILPLSVSINKPLDQYKVDDPFFFSFTPRSDSYVYLFNLDGDETMLVYPLAEQNAWSTATSHVQMVGEISPNRYMLVTKEPSKFHWVLLKDKKALYEDTERVKGDPMALNVPTGEMLKRIENLRKNDPSKVLHLVMDGPIASK